VEHREHLFEVEQPPPTGTQHWDTPGITFADQPLDWNARNARYAMWGHE
jgi:hypothetical protein